MAHLKAATKGRLVNRLPYGLTKLYDTEGKSEVVQVPNEAAVIREAYELAIANRGFKAIADELNLRGHRTKAGKLWATQTIKLILTNPATAGHFVFKGSTETVERRDAYPAILDADEWERLQERLVREALSSAVPVRKPAPKRKRPRVGPVMDFIDAILEEDRKAPRKQRHTAHRIYVRICQERPNWPVSESSVRKYVRGRKLALGLVAGETFVPQHYNWGGEAQVDWYEADAELGGERLTLQVYVMRSMASGGAFHRAYLHATQQAFLEAHEHAFQYIGGVFQRLRYDNLSSAVKRILRGSRREETARFVAFRSHWRFSSEFCTPGEGHEKGGVEAEVGTFRRNHWVPVPKARDLAELNAQLLQAATLTKAGR